MTRTVKDKDLSTREARRRLAFGRRHYRAVEDGVAVYYRRGQKGSGAWGVRRRLSDGAYTEPVLGIADDYSEANEADVLSFAQAQQRALAKAAEAKLDEGAVRNPKTVAEAGAEYLEWFRAEGRKSVNETEHAINAHILPMLGDKRVADLHHRLVQKWLQGVAGA